MNRNVLKFLYILVGLFILFIAFVFLALKINIEVPFLSRFFTHRPAFEVTKHFTFSSEDSLKEWQEKVFKGRVKYKINKQGDECFLDAFSDRAASGLYCKIKMDVQKRPFISWKWRMQKLPGKKSSEDLSKKEEDDFAARVYVIFPAPFFTRTKVIEYIWANNVPEGTITASPYTKNIKLFVIKSGESPDEWFTEERDIYQDYILVFGERPRMNVGAIAIMTDADSTQTTAHAQYGEIKLGYKKDKEK